MSLDRCGQCMRVAIMICCTCGFLGGVLVFAIGIATCVDSSYLNVLLGTNLYLSSAYIMVTCGVLMMAVIWFGCAGALKQRKCYLLIYFVILFFVFVLLLISGNLAYVFQGIAEENMKNTMLTTIQLDYGNVDSVSDTWDELQKKYQCCGIDVEEDQSSASSEMLDGYRVWKRNRKFRSASGPQVPRSCCKVTEEGAFIDEVNCQSSNPASHSTNYAGCLNQTLEFVTYRALVQGGVCLGISGLVVVGMVLSGTLFKIIDSTA